MLEVIGRVYFYFWSHSHFTSLSSQLMKVPNKIDCLSEHSNLLRFHLCKMKKKWSC
jgi:hypothetical protein